MDERILGPDDERQLVHACGATSEVGGADDGKAAATAVLADIELCVKATVEDHLAMLQRPNRLDRAHLSCCAWWPGDQQNPRAMAAGMIQDAAQRSIAFVCAANPGANEGKTRRFEPLD